MTVNLPSQSLLKHKELTLLKCKWDSEVWRGGLSFCISSKFLSRVGKRGVGRPSPPSNQTAFFILSSFEIRALCLRFLWNHASIRSEWRWRTCSLPLPRCGFYNSPENMVTAYKYINQWDRFHHLQSEEFGGSRSQCLRVFELLVLNYSVPRRALVIPLVSSYLISSQIPLVSSLFLDWLPGVSPSRLTWEIICHKLVGDKALGCPS